MSRNELNVVVSEEYGDFVPPVDVKARVLRMLDVVPAKCLIGLESIRLTSTAAFNRDQRREKVWHRGRKVRVADSTGMHIYDRSNDRGWIDLYLDNILAGWTGAALHIPTGVNGAICRALYHEVGHHIEKRASFRARDDEAEAERWALHFWRAYRNRNYWYLFPALILIWAPMLMVRKGSEYLRARRGLRRERKRARDGGC